MDVMLCVQITGAKGSGQRGVLARATKHISMPFAPFVGMEIETSIWHGTRKVCSVTYNVEDQSVFAMLEATDTESDIESAQDYKTHDWEVIEEP